MKSLATLLGLLAFLAIPALGQARTIHLLGGAVAANIPDGARVENGTIVLPASGGFSPNVGVAMYADAKRLAPYTAQLVAELRSANDRVYFERFFSERKAWAIVYSGTIQRPLYHYAYAYETSHGIVLVTATATRRQWSGATGAMLLEILSNMTVYL
ncbi:MAG TPA: hypothetical protein VIM48_09470 [Chthoniobacterales bacterium]